MHFTPNDSQHISAGRKIQQAMVELLQKKPYKSITVSELSELAGVSRQSFYLSFRDKDEVLSQLLVRLFSDIMSAVDSSGVNSVESLIGKYTDIVERHSDFLGILAQNNLGPFLSSVFVSELVNRAPVLKTQKEPENVEERLYINSFWVSAFTDVYTAWLKNGMKTDKDDLNRILTDIMTGHYFTK